MEKELIITVCSRAPSVGLRVTPSVRVYLRHVTLFTQAPLTPRGQCGINLPKPVISSSYSIIRNHNTSFPLCPSLNVSLSSLLVGWLCLTSHRQRGHLETAPPFTVPCEGREAR